MLGSARLVMLVGDDVALGSKKEGSSPSILGREGLLIGRRGRVVAQICSNRVI